MTACQLLHAVPGRVQCPHPGTNRIVVGCVHEHIRSGLICDEHVTSVVEGLRLICDPCRLSPVDPHICALQGRVMA